MSRLRCRLRLFSNSPHTHQIITGFIMLARDGVIDLDVRLSPGDTTSLPTAQIVEATLNDDARIAFDVLDGYNFQPNARPLESYLDDVDFYFKRSYDSARHRGQTESRVYPLGLNYHVVINHPIFRRLSRTSLQSSARYMWHRVSGYYAMYGVQAFEDIPRTESAGEILFLARAWDPGGENFESGVPSAREADERSSINDVRAECIRMLRAEFGPRVVGGFVPSRYAAAHYSDFLIDASLTRKTRYMELVKHAAVCIATMGLHGSNGWKVGEYVAASKAIVSERPRYMAPGNFVPGTNYALFDRPIECVEKVRELLADEHMAYAMKTRNYAYYHTYLRPNRLVLNALVVALSHASGAEREEVASYAKW